MSANAWLPCLFDVMYGHLPFFCVRFRAACTLCCLPCVLCCAADQRASSSGMAQAVSSGSVNTEAGEVEESEVLRLIRSASSADEEKATCETVIFQPPALLATGRNVRFQAQCGNVIGPQFCVATVDPPVQKLDDSQPSQVWRRFVATLEQ